jgi:hypothetical protein
METGFADRNLEDSTILVEPIESLDLNLFVWDLNIQNCSAHYKNSGIIMWSNGYDGMGEQMKLNRRIVANIS